MFDRLIKYFQDLRAKQKASGSRRSPFVIVICVLLVIIPTFLAVYYAYFYEDDSVLSSHNVKIELFGADGSSVFVEEIADTNISDSLLASLFASLTPLSEADIGSVDQVPNYTAKITHDNSTSKYNCYFTDSAMSSFVTDSKQNAYSVSEKTYNAFLNSSVSEASYSTAVPQILSTGNGEAVLPKSGEWHYKLQNNSWRASSPVKTVSDILTYKIGGAIDLSFAQEPTECNIEIYDSNGNNVFSGSLEDAAFLTVEVGATLSAKVSASWIKSTTSEFYGELDYDFKITVGDRSEFSLSTDEIVPGGIAVLSGTNVDDISKIIFSSRARRDISESDALDILYKFRPTFVHDGKKVVALIPFPSGLPEMTYNFSVSYGASEKSFSVHIKNGQTPTKNVLPSASADVMPYISDTALTSLATLMKGISSPSNEMIFFKGAFGSPQNHGLKAGYSYMDELYSNDGLTAFISKGNEYITDNYGGTAVPALNVGIVVKASNCAALGNYVVIDHGAGLRTWYCQLSSIDVSEGDIMARGQTVGKCGSAPLLSSNGVLILSTVYDTIIDPSAILGKELIKK